MDELKACPFCGSGAIWLIKRNHYKYCKYWRYSIQCENEECGVRIGFYGNKVSAYNTWNRRLECQS